MSTPEFRLIAAARTDVGRVRQVNEDSLIARPDVGLWAVADGMGGHEDGQWASREVVAALEQAILGGEFQLDADRVAEAIHAANALIFERMHSDGRSGGSTVAALLLRGSSFAALWAGDSRVYLLRGGDLVQITRDHTQVQEMVEHGLLTPEEAKTHPMAHVISRAVGVEPALELDGVADDVTVGDIFLLCSDGLYGVVSDGEIAQAISLLSPGAACDRLVELSLSRGAPDNVTVVAVVCDEVTRLSLADDET